MASKGVTNAMMVTNKEFFKQACRWKDSSSTQTAADWWSAFLEVIVREVFYNGKCRVPGLGSFTVRFEEGKTWTQPIGGGKFATYTAPARVYPLFAPEDDFINDINMQGVTRKYRKRLKKGELTARDYERELRAEAVKMMDIVDDMVEQRREKAQAELQELLKTKRQLKVAANKATKGQNRPARAVVQMDLQGNFIAEYESMSQAEAKTGIHKIYISNCCDPLRGQKTAGGYKWKYAERREKENEENELSEQSKVSDTES